MVTESKPGEKGPVVAVAVGAVFLASGTLAFMQYFPWFGPSESMFALALIASGLILVGAGLYARHALRLSAADEIAPRKESVTVEETKLSASEIDAAEGFVNPAESYSLELPGGLERQPPSEDPSLPTPVAAAGPGIAARADAEYREAVRPLDASIAFAPALRPAAGVESGSAGSTIAPGPGRPVPRPGGGPVGPTPSNSIWSELLPQSTPTLATTRSGAIATSVLRTVPSPPPAMAHPLTGRRLCASCEAILPNDPNVPLCWGCGRSLCTACYWKNGSGPGLHRCSECAAQNALLYAGRSGAVAGPVTTGAVAPVGTDRDGSPATDARSTR